ncbi:MADS-box transcription factor 29-like [Dioscorea cayenensis subsp. rotundata]|uniref:MADS-box transcription factor 29-like n=1 Tax=Dioscorea cayennensis subsp. rotundata TaxID=55577 RepID=A0AB40AJ71_DIOCR|nr:MADS-box transcription factor 29-like [Dioscorea cayenensis subsp. rotundata]
MGRGKIEIKRIENTTNRQVTFSKRRQGLLKKAHELAVLCDAQLGLVIFSHSGKLFEYCSPSSSMRQIIDRYQKATNIRIEEAGSQHQILCEISKLRNENDKLQAGMRQYMGEDLTALTAHDLDQLEEQLEYSVNKVRARKHQLLHQQLENLRRKEHLLEDQNSHLYHALVEQQAAMEHQHQQAAAAAEAEQKISEIPVLEFPHFYHDEASRTFLQLSPQLHPFRLQPTQPNLQDTSFGGHGLQL